MIAIIDYGMGNLASVKNAFAKIGYKAFTTSDPEEILKAEKVVLPGVGAFADAIRNLGDLGLDKAIHETVANKTPFLGICLGLQLLFSESEENGLYKGLDIVPGKVVKFRLPPVFKVPQIGWNQIYPASESRLFRGISPGSHFYFVHSYYVIPEDTSYTAATSDYKIEFTCAAEKESLFATQFHPEKSGKVGLKVLQNFAEI